MSHLRRSTTSTTYLKGNARNAPQMAEQCKKLINAEDERPFFLYFATSTRTAGAASTGHPSYRRSQTCSAISRTKNRTLGSTRHSTLRTRSSSPSSSRTRRAAARRSPNITNRCSRIDQGAGTPRRTAQGGREVGRDLDRLHRRPRHGLPRRSRPPSTKPACTSHSSSTIRIPNSAAIKSDAMISPHRYHPIAARLCRCLRCCRQAPPSLS